MAAVEPEILAVTADEHIRLDLRVPEDLRYFEGHFPDCPLLPGVVQTHWAMLYGRRYFGMTGEFRGLSQVKFMRVIVPGALASLHLSWNEAARALSFEYRAAGASCSAGTLQLSAP